MTDAATPTPRIDEIEREVERRWQEMLNDEANDDLLIVTLPEELSW